MVSGVSFSGLASGLDTDEILQQLLELERRPLQKLQQQEEAQQKQQKAWQDLKMEVASLQDRIASLHQSDVYLAREAESSREDLLTAIAGETAAEADYQVQVTQLAQAHQVASDAFTAPLSEYDLESFEEEDAAQFEIGIEGGQKAVVDVYETDTLADLADRINNLDAGVRASVVDYRLVLGSEQTGEDNSIELAEKSENGTILQDLGLFDEQGDFITQLLEPQDAEFTVDGLSVQRSHNVGIDDVLEGVTIDLHAASPGEAFSLSVSHDTGVAVEKIASFVDEYNQLQDQLASLADRGGLLEADSTIRRLQTNLRQQVTAPVELEEGEYTLLAQVGVEIDRHGNMSLDQNHLVEALQDNPEDVRLLFGARQEEAGVDGMARRLDDYLTGYLRHGEGIFDNKNRMYDRMMRDTAARMESVQRRIEMREQSLTRQFTELERMLGQVQNQGQWLEGQLQNFVG